MKTVEKPSYSQYLRDRHSHLLNTIDGCADNSVSHNFVAWNQILPKHYRIRLNKDVNGIIAALEEFLSKQDFENIEDKNQLAVQIIDLIFSSANSYYITVSKALSKANDNQRKMNVDKIDFCLRCIDLFKARRKSQNLTLIEFERSLQETKVALEMKSTKPRLSVKKDKEKRLSKLVNVVMESQQSRRPNLPSYKKMLYPKLEKLYCAIFINLKTSKSGLRFKKASEHRETKSR